MPIDIEEFESADPGELRGEEDTLRQQVLEYLAYNPESAYSREELQGALDVDAIQILHALTTLEREGLVRHKGRYWAIERGHGREDAVGERL